MLLCLEAKRAMQTWEAWAWGRPRVYSESRAPVVLNHTAVSHNTLATGAYSRRRAGLGGLDDRYNDCGVRYSVYTMYQGIFIYISTVYTYTPYIYILYIHTICIYIPYIYHIYIVYTYTYRLNLKRNLSKICLPKSRFACNKSACVAKQIYVYP